MSCIHLEGSQGVPSREATNNRREEARDLPSARAAGGLLSTEAKTQSRTRPPERVRTRRAYPAHLPARGQPVVIVEPLPWWALLGLTILAAMVAVVLCAAVVMGIAEHHDRQRLERQIEQHLRSVPAYMEKGWMEGELE